MLGHAVGPRLDDQVALSPEWGMTDFEDLASIAPAFTFDHGEQSWHTLAPPNVPHSEINNKPTRK